MNYYAQTKRYYGQWTHVDADALDRQGVLCVESSERDRVQDGYTKRFDLYIMYRDNSAIISYGSNGASIAEAARQCYERASSLEDFVQQLRNMENVEVGHAVKFYFGGLPNIASDRAVQLGLDQYEDYRSFFCQQHPNTDPDDWLPGYFSSIAAKGYCWGVYEDGALVSVTDAPTVPYMPDVIVEPGINTLTDYRKKGYAKIVCAALIKYLIQQGKVPIWSCGSHNTESARLAESLGYRKFGDAIMLELVGPLSCTGT